VTRYEGPDRASVLTGLAEGTYYFRVRQVNDGRPGPWSEPLPVEVEFMSRARVCALLGAGFLVTAMSLAAILHGHFRSNPAS